VGTEVPLLGGSTRNSTQSQFPVALTSFSAVQYVETYLGFMAESFTISVSSAADANSNAVELCVELVNAAYGRGEEGMWKSGNKAARTNHAEMAAHLAEGNILIAREREGIGSEAVRITGCIFVNSAFAAGTGELGMLSAASDCLGRGLGKQLVQAAEQHCRLAGCAHMRLELLTPRDFCHPTKAWLDRWYQRMGYTKGQPDDFGRAFPRIAPLLACECVFTAYLKAL